MDKINTYPISPEGLIEYLKLHPSIEYDDRFSEEDRMKAVVSPKDGFLVSAPNTIKLSVGHLLGLSQ